MLSMKLNVCSNIVQDNNLINEVDTQNNIHIPDTSWSASSRTKYIQALNSPDIQKKIMYLNEINNDGQTLIDGLPEIMVSAGTLSVFKKSVKRKSKGRPRRINKRWYDNDCYKLLREVKSAKKKKKTHFQEMFQMPLEESYITENLRSTKDLLNSKSGIIEKN